VRGAYAVERSVGVAVPVQSISLEDWLRATPDGFVVTGKSSAYAPVLPGSTVEWPNVDGVTTLVTGALAVARADGVLGLVQVKTCSREAWRSWDEQPPLHHVIQARTEMAVTKLPWCDLVYLVGGQRMEVHRIERDEKMEADLLTDLRAFVERARRREEPDVDGSESWRRIASERMQFAQKITLTANADHLELIARWREVRRARKEAVREEEHLKNELLLAMGAAGATTIDGAELGKTSAYRTGGRTDYKGAYEALSGGAPVPAQFVKSSTTWALKAPKQWDDE
jgi:hypothetical protein